MATQVYGDGSNSSQGANTVTHHYDRAGIKAANRVNVYGQFADKKSMPQKMGKNFKISKFIHMYDRNPVDDADFAAKGYMTARTATDVSTALTNAGLAEGAGAVNQRTLQKITMTTELNRFGEMLEYSDEVDLFSEDDMQVRYHEELGELANSRWEDKLQMDMLGTTTVLYSGVATSMATIGDLAAVDGGEDADWKVTYDLIRRSTKRLKRNRAKMNTSIVTGSTKVGTTPVAAAYYAIIGADVKSDLEMLTIGSTYEKKYIFVPAHQYAGATTLAEGEVGQMHDVRFIEAEAAVVYAGQGAFATAWRNNDALTDTDPRYTTEAEAIAGGSNVAATLVAYVGSLAVSDVGAEGATKLDVHPILFPTQGAFATVGLKGRGKINFHSAKPQDVSIVNPYGTVGFFSYNFFYAGIILEEEKLLKVLVAAGQ